MSTCKCGTFGVTVEDLMACEMHFKGHTILGCQICGGYTCKLFFKAEQCPRCDVLTTVITRKIGQPTTYKPCGHTDLSADLKVGNVQDGQDRPAVGG